MHFLTRGKRGDIYLAKRGKKIVVVKRQRFDSTAVHRLENEAFWLKKLNAYGIGPRFLFFERGGLVMEYIAGKTIEDYLNDHAFSKKLAKEILLQCRILDQLHVNKLEMHHPFKHILIKPGKTDRKHVVMVDFERCKQTPYPKNVTQFCQYLLRQGWPVSREKILPFLKKYKQSQDSRSFNQLLRTLF